MCSGGFDFGNANKFEVEFSFMDTSGNMTAWSGNKIKFNRPKENEISEGSLIDSKTINRRIAR